MARIWNPARAAWHLGEQPRCAPRRGQAGRQAGPCQGHRSAAPRPPIPELPPAGLCLPGRPAWAHASEAWPAGRTRPARPEAALPGFENFCLINPDLTNFERLLAPRVPPAAKPVRGKARRLHPAAPPATWRTAPASRPRAHPPCRPRGACRPPEAAGARPHSPGRNQPRPAADIEDHARPRAIAHARLPCRSGQKA